jgi:Family of unknown function (DUF6502)
MTDRPNVLGESGDASAQIKTSLISAFRRLMRPLVRILIRHGVSFPEFAEIAKLVYVETAASDFPLDERKVSGARIAILTGLTRKDVKRIMEGRNGSELVTNNLSRAGRVLTGWHQDSDFLATHYGVPRDLPFDDPNDVSFTELVRRYSGDMPARAMLEELLRVGAVIKTEDDALRVAARSYNPSPFNPDAVARIGITMHDLAATLDHNLNPARKTRSRFERRVYATEGLSKQYVEQFHDLIKQRGQQLLETLDNWLTMREADPSEETENINRIGVGIYLFEDDDTT